jgi:hypothetical protein
MPKCAGTSVRALLEASAPCALRFDYDDNYFRIPRKERSDVILRCLLEPGLVPDDELVYGHFFPIKYLGSGYSSEIRLVTILRDPIARLVSHFDFWNRGDFPDHYLWRRMKAERWTLEDFIMSHEMRNFYAQYFTQVPLNFFTYIGLYEMLEESIKGCMSALGLQMKPADLPNLNAAPTKAVPLLSQNFISEAIDFHSDDYLIYRFALDRFHGNRK